MNPDILRQNQTIDFSDYPEILEWLKQAARAEMRPPDMQALACIATYLDGIQAKDPVKR